MERVEYDNGNGGKLVGVLDMPSNHSPIVILCHGLGSSKDSATYRGIQHGLELHGIGTIRFDFYAHGESDGHFDHLTLTEGIRNIKATYDYLKSRYPHSHIGIQGSSYGGAAAFFAAPDLKLEGVALCCPALYYQKGKKKRMGPAKMKEWEKKGFVYYTNFAGRKLKLGYGFYEDLADYDPEKVTFDAPFMIVHGDKDQNWPVTDSKKIAKLRKAKMHVIKGADHNYTGKGQKDKMIDHVVHFFMDIFAMDPEHTHGHKL